MLPGTEKQLGCLCRMDWASLYREKNCWAWEQNPHGGAGWPDELNGDRLAA